MNKKGFTLIELLAVIVILAIIALIAVPIILNVIEKSKKGAAEASAYGYIDAVEKYIIFHDVDIEKYPYNLKDGTFNLVSETSGVPGLRNFIEIKGDKPTRGTITINKKGKVTSAELGINGYRVVCNNNKCVSSGTFEEITITYSLNGGTLDKESEKAYKGDVIDLPSPTPPSGYEFDGWYTASSGGNKVTNETVFNETTTLYARYERIPIKVSTITISPNSVNMKVGDSKKLSATILPENADDKSIVWSSSDTSIATVDNAGNITSVSAGTATIRATASDGSKKYGEATINVKAINELISDTEGMNIILNDDALINQLFSSSSLFQTLVNNSTSFALACENSKARLAMYNNASVTESIIGNSSSAISVMKASSHYKKVTSPNARATHNNYKVSLYNKKSFVIQFSHDAVTGYNNDGSIYATNFTEVSDGQLSFSPSSCNENNNNKATVNRFASSITGWRSGATNNGGREFHYYAYIFTIEE